MPLGARISRQPQPLSYPLQFPLNVSEHTSSPSLRSSPGPSPSPRCATNGQVSCSDRFLSLQPPAYCPDQYSRSLVPSLPAICIRRDPSAPLPVEPRCSPKPAGAQSSFFASPETNQAT